MRLAVSKDGKTFKNLKTVSTPRDDFEEGVRMFIEVAKEASGGEKIKAVAGGLAGTLDKEHVALLRAPNMPGWIEKPFKKRLEEMFGVPAYLENDAALAGLGEVVAGAGRGYSIAAYVTVSTGVGGVRIVDGAIDRNAMGFEIGHQVIHCDGETRTLEECVSGSGFLRRFGKLPQDVSNLLIWEEMTRLLAVGLRNTVLHWSPEALVLGGPMLLRSPFSFEMFGQYFEKSVLEVFPSVPEVKKAELGDKSGIHGALAFLHAKSGFD